MLYVSWKDVQMIICLFAYHQVYYIINQLANVKISNKHKIRYSPLFIALSPMLFTFMMFDQQKYSTVKSKLLNKRTFISKD